MMDGMSADVEGDPALTGVQGEFALAIMDDPDILKLAKALPTCSDLPQDEEVVAARDAAEKVASVCTLLRSHS